MSAPLQDAGSRQAPLADTQARGLPADSLGSALWERHTMLAGNASPVAPQATLSAELFEAHSLPIVQSAGQQRRDGTAPLGGPSSLAYLQRARAIARRSTGLSLQRFARNETLSGETAGPARGLDGSGVPLSGSLDLQDLGLSDAAVIGEAVRVASVPSGASSGVRRAAAPLISKAISASSLPLAPSPSGMDLQARIGDGSMATSPIGLDPQRADVAARSAIDGPAASAPALVSSHADRGGQTESTGSVVGVPPAIALRLVASPRIIPRPVQQGSAARPSVAMSRAASGSSSPAATMAGDPLHAAAVGRTSLPGDPLSPGPGMAASSIGQRLPLSLARRSVPGAFPMVGAQPFPTRHAVGDPAFAAGYRSTDGRPAVSRRSSPAASFEAPPVLPVGALSAPLPPPAPEGVTVSRSPGIGWEAHRDPPLAGIGAPHAAGRDPDIDEPRGPADRISSIDRSAASPEHSALPDARSDDPSWTAGAGASATTVATAAFSSGAAASAPGLRAFASLPDESGRPIARRLLVASSPLGRSIDGTSFGVRDPAFFPLGTRATSMPVSRSPAEPWETRRDRTPIATLRPSAALHAAPAAVQREPLRSFSPGPARSVGDDQIRLSGRSPAAVFDRAPVRQTVARERARSSGTAASSATASMAGFAVPGAVVVVDRQTFASGPDDAGHGPALRPLIAQRPLGWSESGEAAEATVASGAAEPSDARHASTIVSPQAESPHDGDVRHPTGIEPLPFDRGPASAAHPATAAIVDTPIFAPPGLVVAAQPSGAAGREGTASLMPLTRLPSGREPLVATSRAAGGGRVAGLSATAPIIVRMPVVPSAAPGHRDRRVEPLVARFTDAAMPLGRMPVRFGSAERDGAVDRAYVDMPDAARDDTPAPFGSGASSVAIPQASRADFRSWQNDSARPARTVGRQSIALPLVQPKAAVAGGTAAAAIVVGRSNDPTPDAVPSLASQPTVPSRATTSADTTALAAPAHAAGVDLDLDELAERTLTRLMRLLTIERERRGVSIWPS